MFVVSQHKPTARHRFIMIAKCIHIHYCSSEPSAGHAVPAPALEGSARICPPTPTTRTKAVLSSWVEKHTAKQQPGNSELFFFS